MEQLCGSLKGADSKKAEIIFCPSFTALFAARETLKKLGADGFKLGAQNVFWRENGAFTGEVSAKMLKEVGCEYVIVGHSERRQNLGETDGMVNRKVNAALKNHLTPIVCVGETREERQNGLRDAVVAGQAGAVMKGVKIVGAQKIIIAYEPVWAIGAGQAVEPEDAAHSHRMIREALLEIFSRDAVEKHFNIIYGGSVDGKNIKSFVERENIDGVLVGGASLKAGEVVKMIKEII